MLGFVRTHPAKLPTAVAFVAAFACGGALAAPKATTVLRAAGYVDVERNTIVRPAVLVIEGDRIASVGSREAKPPAGASVVDLGGAILLPGLIDTHVHLMLAGAARENARKTLEAGFTTEIGRAHV